MTNADNIVESIETAESTKKTPFAFPKSKTAYAIYGAGALLVVAGIAGGILGRKQLNDADDAAAEDTETSVN